MVNTIAYPYAQTNLLTQRYHYQYTPYQGPAFLRAYLAQRHTFRDQLISIRERLLINPTEEIAMAEEIRQAVLGSSTQVGETPLKNHRCTVTSSAPGERDFQTRSLLLDLWHVAIYRMQDFDRTCLPWTNFLLQRYEVTKRLYVGYGADLKPSEGKFDVTGNYALLAALLAHRCIASPDIKALNTLLKLVDLLASLGTELQNSLTQLTSLVAAEAELLAVEGLFGQHEVAP